MTVSLRKSDSVVHLALSGELTAVDAPALYGQLFVELDAETSLVLDANGVTRIDTSIAQVVLFLARAARDFRVEAHSAAWDSAWTTLGLKVAAAGPR